MSSGAAAPHGTPPGATSVPRPRASKVSDTSAKPAGPRLSEPAKITSSMARPRRCLADCSPITQRMASTMFDLPQPFGPTIDVMGSGKESDVLSTNDLKPQMSIFLIFNRASAERKAERKAATLR